MNNLLIITGPTATGKSALAVEIAQELAVSGLTSEIISADSRQVYTGLDIGSAKITPAEMDGIPHHMIDIADPAHQTFTVADFQKLAREQIMDIQSRGKLPILCGGTGMYIDATVYNMQFPNVEPNQILRTDLDTKTTEELFNILSKLNPERAGNIDASNRVRLIRAIEVASTPNLLPNENTNLQIYETYKPLWIGLQLPKEIMLERIHTRIIDRIPALFDEIQHLRDTGVSEQRLHQFGLEYRYGLMYVNQEITEPQFVDLLTTKTWQFSKRQMTWFRRNTEINWFNPINDKQKILELIKDFLNT